MEMLIANQEDGLTDKSRDMGATWMGMAMILCHWLHDDGGFTAHLGSQKEDYVDKSHDIKTLFEKIRYMLKRLPPELQPIGYNPRVHSSFMKLYNPENGNLITGESANKNFGRQARATLTWMDEFASWQHDEESWTSISEVTPVKFVASTPKGRHNCFARLRHHSSINVKSLHWRTHPEKDEAWYQKKKSSNKFTTQEIAQELDIDYSGSAGAPVVTFERKYNIKKYKFNPDLPLIRSIDYGKAHPCLSLAQIDGEGIAHKIYEMLGKDINIFDFGLVCLYVTGVKLEDEKLERIKYLCMENKIVEIPHMAHLKVFHAKEYDDYCDSAGKQMSDKSNQTSIDILTSMGFDLSYRWARVDEGTSVMSKVFRENSYYIDPACIFTVQALEGGYHKDNLGEPVKEGFFEHFIDCDRYWLQEKFDYLIEGEKEEVPKSEYQKMVDNGMPAEYAAELEKLRSNMFVGNSNNDLMVKSHGTGYYLGGY